MNRVILLFILSIFLTLDLSAQYENGVLPIRTYGTSDYGGQQQVFDIKCDTRGVIYASNRSGLLELSGETWKIYKIREEVQVRTIAIDSLGYIYVGGDGEFGYFSIDSNRYGKLVYHSISKILEEKNKDINIGEIKSIAIKDGTTYFQSRKSLYIWRSDSLKVLTTKTRFLYMFSVSNKLLIPIKEKGYFILEGDSLHKAYSTKEKEIAIVSAPYGEKQSLTYRPKYGFRLASIVDNKIRFGKKISTSIDITKDLKIIDILQISDDFYSVATRQNIFIINKNGKLIHAINKTHGLKSSIITTQTIDLNKTLWIGTENGIAKVDALSNLTFFPHKTCNYSGRIQDVKRYNGHIHIITPSGLYILDKNTKSLTTELKSLDSFEKNCMSKFSRLKRNKSISQSQKSFDSLYAEIENPCWDLETFELEKDKLLLISTNNYLLSLDPENHLQKIVDCYPYCSYQSKSDPRRVYIGLDGGFQSVYLSPSGKWINEGLVDGINEVIIDVYEDHNGNLWLSTNVKGVIYIEKPKFDKNKIQNPKILKLKKGLVSIDPLSLQEVNNKMLYATSMGIYNFSWEDSSFYFDPKLNSDTNNRHIVIHRISKDFNNNIWTVSINDESKICKANYYAISDSGNFDKQTVFAKKGEVIFSFNHDKNNITWMGGTNGLSRVNISKKRKDNPIYHTYLTTVLNNEDTTFGGYYQTESGVSLQQPESFVRTFDFKHNSFTFYFSASSPRDYNKLQYSWFLEGYEHELNWGPWSDKTYKEYTNLNEGHYIFHVRAIDVYGNISKEASYEFYVDPPWYRTIWAFFGYIIFFITFVWAAIRISTRSLKRIIKAATAEIQSQKDQLEEKNQNIIDSIRYAQRIQEAVVPSNALFHESFKDSFVLWKPRDIVSGDFYWLAPRNNQIFVAAADCTGHGVPGAFMSIMGISFLNQIVALPEVKNAADMLNNLRNNVIKALNKEQSDTANKDGMDIALCVFDLEKKQVDYAGAYNSLYIYRKGELIEIKADRMPIGVHDRDSVPFKNNTVDLQSGDQLYMFSDGYIDQFGGPKGKKFMTKRFKKLLLEITDKSMSEQKDILWKNILDWRGDIEQLDDIIIIGIRIE